MSLARAILCFVRADIHNIFESTGTAVFREKNAKKLSHYNKFNFKENNSVRWRHKLLCAIGISLGVLMQIRRVRNQADYATNWRTRYNYFGF